MLLRQDILVVEIARGRLPPRASIGARQYQDVAQARRPHRRWLLARLTTWLLTSDSLLM